MIVGSTRSVPLTMLTPRSARYAGSAARAGETNRLIALAKEIQAHPDPRELDVVAATGEQVTIGLLSMALLELGVKARSYSGWQVKIITNSAFNKARITSIDDRRVRADLNA